MVQSGMTRWDPSPHLSYTTIHSPHYCTVLYMLLEAHTLGSIRGKSTVCSVQCAVCSAKEPSEPHPSVLHHSHGTRAANLWYRKVILHNKTLRRNNRGTFQGQRSRCCSRRLCVVSDSQMVLHELRSSNHIGIMQHESFQGSLSGFKLCQSVLSIKDSRQGSQTAIDGLMHIHCISHTSYSAPYLLQTSR